MAEYVEGAHTGEHIISEAPGSRSREDITIAASQTLKPGALLGKVLTGAKSGTAAALGTNTGGVGTIGSITVDADAPLGDYKVVCIEPASNAGAFVVENPDGTINGHGAIGVAYNGLHGVNFTWADATDAVAGDGYTITVVAADATAQGQYKGLDLTASDGTQIVAAVLYGAVTTGVGETADAVGHVRDCEVNGYLIVHQSGADAAAKAVNATALATLGIIVR
jgi:hypothetical protein